MIQNVNTQNLYKAPRHNSPSFHCPFCGIHAQMQWTLLENKRPMITSATCTACQAASIWREDLMIYPETGIAPPPHVMMPEPVYYYYDLARAASRNLPIAACAFLRQAIARIFVMLGCSGENFNKDIDNLVVREFGTRTFWAPMIKVRLAGFDTVKPGVLDTRDDQAMMELLFYFTNQIIEETIANPQHVAEFCAKISSSQNQPEEKKIDPDFFQRP